MPETIELPVSWFVCRANGCEWGDRGCYSDGNRRRHHWLLISNPEKRAELRLRLAA